MSETYDLVVASTSCPLPDVRTISLAVPDALRERFAFVAGQHLILRRSIAEDTLIRCYSIHACPHTWTTLDMSVRRIEGGRVSGDLVDSLQAGQTLKVSPPRGNFVAAIQPRARRTFFLFAAGTGITPILSMAKSVLKAEPKSFVRLLYGNRHEQSVLFGAQLKELQAQYGARLVVVHCLSAAKDRWGQDPQQLRGRIGKDTVRSFLNAYPPPAQDCEYRICGPGAMNRSVRALLMELGVEPERIGVEQFGAPQQEASSLEDDQASRCSFELQGQRHEVEVAKGQHLLDAMLEHSDAIPHACRAGICGSCVATLEAGKVHMDHAPALSQEDLDQGRILVCQARGRSDLIKLRF